MDQQFLEHRKFHLDLWDLARHLVQRFPMGLVLHLVPQFLVDHLDRLGLSHLWLRWHLLFHLVQQYLVRRKFPKVQSDLVHHLDRLHHSVPPLHLDPLFLEHHLFRSALLPLLLRSLHQFPKVRGRHLVRRFLEHHSFPMVRWGLVHHLVPLRRKVRLLRMDRQYLVLHLFHLGQ